MAGEEEQALRDRLADLTTTLEAERERCRQGEEALHDAEERYRLLVEGARDYAIVLLDRDGRIATWNEGARRLVGYEAEEVVGGPTSVLFTPEDRERGLPERELRTAAAAWPGLAVVTVSCAETSPEGQPAVRVAVRDNGLADFPEPGAEAEGLRALLHDQDQGHRARRLSWPLPGASSRPTAARSAWARSPAPGPRSSSPCRGVDYDPPPADRGGRR
jgi:PAS domain-containing protein